MKHVSQRYRWSLVAVLAVILGALGGPSAPAASRPLVPLAQEDGPPLDVEVIRVERLDHSTQLLLTLENRSDDHVSRIGLNDPAFGYVEDIEFNDLSGIHLLDKDANVEYLPYRNGDENLCMCARIGGIDAGERWTLWWRSEPLPDEVDVVSVLGPEGEILAEDVEVEA
jgi:hypothetical protein